MANNIPPKNKICTMESTTDFCAIKGPRAYKWPKLSELHYKLFSTGFDQAHYIDLPNTIIRGWILLLSQMARSTITKLVETYCYGTSKSSKSGYQSSNVQGCSGACV